MTMRHILLAPALLPFALHAAEFHVSPGGDDAGPGSRQRPFATLQRAQQAARLTARAGLKEDLTIHLADGVYELTQPLHFDPADGGTKDHAVTYAALPGTKPVLSGGRRVEGWREAAKGLWEADVPSARAGDWNPRQLFVNGRRAQRARWPNADAKPAYRRLKGAAMAEDRSVFTVTLDPPDVNAWEHVEDIEVVICGHWEITRKKLAAVDPATGVLTLALPHAGGHPAMRAQAGRFTFLENAREFLDQPGEWYLDRSRGVVTYWPLPEERLADCRFVMPRLTQLMEVRGTAEKPVRNLHFRGLQFRYTDWDFPAYGFNGIQASFHTFPDEGQTGWAWSPWKCTPAALVWEFTEDCSLRDGALDGLGGVGVRLYRGCHRNVVEGNLVQQIGGNGIMVGEYLTRFAWGKDKLPEGELPTKNRIANNLIRRCGLDDYGAVGVWVSFTDGTEVSHNLLYDLPYSGISVGWQWSDVPTENRNNLVEANHVHTVLQKLCDGGCLYTLGRQPGTVIRGNHFHGAQRSETAQGAPNNGIFFDQGSREFQVENNLIYGTSGAPIRFNQCKREWHTWAGNRFGRTRAAPGLIGPGLCGDGSSSCIEIPHAPELDPAELTAEAWVYLDRWTEGGDPRRWVINKNKNEWAAGHWALMTERNKAGAYLNIGGGQQNCFEAWSTEGALSLETWHHLAFTYDSKDLRVYVDGKEVGMTTIDRPRKPGTTPVVIGRRQDAYNYFLGTVDEVCLYSRTLTQPELAARCLAKGTTPPKSLPLVGHWGFEDLAEASRVKDEVEAAAGLQPPYRKRLQP
ncbi:MAG: hypothetical protein HN849_16155 [Victivallales bacterium]|nr:hypothetical protein [Victivallales bacterium]